METSAWIEKLDNPLVLTAFVVFVLAGVISLFIRKTKPNQSQKIGGKHNTGQQAGGDMSINTPDSPKKSKK